jgi:MOSC domain-containing protein YiiM
LRRRTPGGNIVRGTIAMPTHLTRAELEAGLPEILAAPADDGTLLGIVVRPDSDARLELETCAISLAGGVHGDRWADGCWMSTDDGHPHPDVQICMMNARAIALIARDRANWSPAGDNLFIDMDLSPANLPPGQRLGIGSAIIEITSVPHNGCDKFIARYGRDACVFVNTGEGKRLRLRGIYARVVQDGQISVGDRVRKLAPAAVTA